MLSKSLTFLFFCDFPSSFLFKWKKLPENKGENDLMPMKRNLKRVRHRLIASLLKLHYRLFFFLCTCRILIGLKFTSKGFFFVVLKKFFFVEIYVGFYRRILEDSPKFKKINEYFSFFDKKFNQKPTIFGHKTWLKNKKKTFCIRKESSRNQQPTLNGCPFFAKKNYHSKTFSFN